MSSSSPPVSPGVPAQRRPALVEAPLRRAAADMRFVRLRIRDRPGSLAAVTQHLASHGVDVVRLEVLDREDAYAVDDFLLRGPSISAALAALGANATVLADRPHAQLVDPALAMATACAAVTGAVSGRDAYRQLVQAALGLVFAEAGFVCVPETHGFLRPLAATDSSLPAIEDGGTSLLRSALASGECLTADGRTPWAPEQYRVRLPRGSVAAVPGGAPSFLVLALVREDDSPFVATELERLDALVRVAVGTLLLHETRAHASSTFRT
jgi:hypothetical protein